MAKKQLPQLCDDRILVRTPPPEDKTEGGIVLPANTTNKLQIRSEVVAVGPGSVVLFREGRRPLPCKVGDTVIHEFPGHDFEYEGETLKMLREPDVQAVVS